MTSLPYGNGAFGMIFILPEAGNSLADIVPLLAQEGYWEQCLASMTLKDVDLFIPRWKTECEIELNNVLRQAGMAEAFVMSADFSGIADIHPLFVSKIKQKSYIEVNEEGTEAAAVTSVEFELTSVPPPDPEKPTFRADRPFLFALCEQSSGILLFTGKVARPTLAKD
jgi:serpin B